MDWSALHLAHVNEDKKIQTYSFYLIVVGVFCFATTLSKFDWSVIFSLVAMLSVMRSIPQRVNAVFGHLGMLFCFGQFDSKAKIELQP